MTLKTIDYQEEFSGYGRVRALLDTVVSSEVQGVVVEVSPDLEAGSAIKKGTVLIKIDDRDYQEALGRHKATSR